MTLSHISYFPKITLPCTIPEMNEFLVFYAEIQDGHKNGRKQIWQNLSDDSLHTLFGKNLIKIALSYIVSEINEFYVFYTEFQNCLENDFWHQVPDGLEYPGGEKFCQNHSILHSFQHSQPPTKTKNGIIYFITFNKHVLLK